MAKLGTDSLKTGIVKTMGVVPRVHRDPDVLLGELFEDVQSQRIFPDGKTFVDLVPKKWTRSIAQQYKILKKDPEFDLREFVSQHFTDLAETVQKREPFVHDPAETTSEHISRLWEHLERRNRIERGSLLELPHKYVVPGGRFNEQFYWDSYFIMLGLAAEGKWELVEGMVKNYAFMLRRYGFIPTANRSYFLSRSQPPFFVLMVQLLARHKGKRVIREYLPYLVQEYRFWMKGRRKLVETEHNAYRRVVQLDDGSLVNRYYDNKVTPRPESHREDIETAAQSGGREADRLYLHLRAAAESGWDFSSRWFSDPCDIKTIHTADIIPVDLNSLLYLLETTIADATSTLRHPITVSRYRKAADRRKAAINTQMWNEAEGFYVDYNFHHRTPTAVLSLAGVFPLYAGLASPEQAARVATRLEQDFLKTGGLVTTLQETGQQWDSPNGWAPLQWMAVEGLRRYGFNELATTISTRWLALNDTVYSQTGKLVEKYNVCGGDGLGGGGEYALQDGFGWTNGVYVALKRSRKAPLGDR
jgi:alpha,alpha-trehalase